MIRVQWSRQMQVELGWNHELNALVPWDEMRFFAFTKET